MHKINLSKTLFTNGRTELTSRKGNRRNPKSKILLEYNFKCLITSNEILTLRQNQYKFHEETDAHNLL